MEVEYRTNDNVDVTKEKEAIQEIIYRLNIKVSEELNMRKPEMY